MSKFTHLHLHSEFSLLDGANRVDELVDRVKEMGQTAVAITDHGRLASTIPFVQKCLKEGVKPIIGCEGYINDISMAAAKDGKGNNYHLTLLAMSDVGFHNMVHVTSKAAKKGFHHSPRMDKKTLKKHAEGIMMLTGCIGAELPQLITQGREEEVTKLMEYYQETFGDNFRIEIMYHGGSHGVDHTRIEDDGGKVLIQEGQLNDELIRLAKKYGVPIVATNDAHYLHERDGTHHDTLICKGKGKFDSDRTFRFPGAECDSWEFFVKSEEEMRAVGTRWGDIWEAACEETQRVADMIKRDVVPMNQSIFPLFEIPRDIGFEHWQETGEFIV